MITIDSNCICLPRFCNMFGHKATMTREYHSRLAAQRTVFGTTTMPKANNFDNAHLPYSRCSPVATSSQAIFPKSPALGGLGHTSSIGHDIVRLDGPDRLQIHHATETTPQIQISGGCKMRLYIARSGAAESEQPRLCLHITTRSYERAWEQVKRSSKPRPKLRTAKPPHPVPSWWVQALCTGTVQMPMH